MAGSLLILGAGCLGAAIASRALDAGEDVVLADNWFATERTQVSVLEPRGARVVTADLRDGAQIHALLAAEQPAKVLFLASQASRPLSFEDPEYTEQTNLVGPRHVAAA